jgi:DNA polymerase IIIc chi subunit
MMKNPEQMEYIDKSLVSRHHSQFISHQIADEARLNNHKMDLSEEDIPKLIRNHRIASIEYSHDVDKRE